VRRLEAAENIVVAADVFHHDHRFAAARRAALEAHVDFRPRQLRQHLLHLIPDIRVALHFHGDGARAAKVAHAQVVGRQRQPQPVGMLCGRRHLRHQFRQVAGAGADAFPCVEAVLDAQVVRRILGQHHHAAHVGVGGRQRVPFRLLVGQRGDQAPVDAGQVLRRLEMAPPLRQPGLRVVDEARDAFTVDALDVAEVAVVQSRQRAVGVGAGDEGVGLGAQALGVLAAEGPA